MSNNQNRDIALTLRDNVKVLMDKCRTLHRQNRELEEILENQKDELSILKERVQDMEAKYNNIITSGGLTLLEGDARAARLRVNRLVREIDKCISSLNE